MECYDPFVNVWRTCAPMSVPRSRAGVAVLDGLIYACGGAYGSQYHSSVERYYNMENRWESVSPMIMPRIGLGCAVVNRLLYAIGKNSEFLFYTKNHRKFIWLKDTFSIYIKKKQAVSMVKRVWIKWNAIIQIKMSGLYDHPCIPLEAEQVIISNRKLIEIN